MGQTTRDDLSNSSFSGKSLRKSFTPVLRTGIKTAKTLVIIQI